MLDHPLPMTDMTPTLDFAPLKASCIWTIREGSKILTQKKNLLTSYGLTNLASLWGGAPTVPNYLVLDNNLTTLAATALSGASSVSLTARIDQAGDTQIILNPGQASQEMATFSGVTGVGPYVYTLTGTLINSHSSGETVIRQVNLNDTISNVIGESQYDSVNFPNQRLTAASGYSNGAGNWTSQFYLPSGSANLLFITLGLADTLTIGTGNLHNHIVLGLDHTTSTNDLEIDVVLTLTN